MKKKIEKIGEFKSATKGNIGSRVHGTRQQHCSQRGWGTHFMSQ